MTRDYDGPRSLGDTLRHLTQRYRRVDLYVIDDIKKMWPDIVGDALARRCSPELVKDHALIVRVPSGAFAERLRSDEVRIIAGFADLKERAPQTLRIVVGEAPV